jgi:ribonuclease HI
MKVEVYTDGGCMNNGKKFAKAAYGYYFPEHKELSFAAIVPDDQPQTNNRGELLGILEAIKKVQSSFPAENIGLHIFTDSEYAKNCITKWLPGWISKNWKTATGTSVVNRDLIEDISKRLIFFESHMFTHVRAHTGGDDIMSQNNHIVDRMVAKVLNPEEEIVAKPGVQVKGPLQVMGPPVSETQLYTWCMANLHELDSTILRNAMVSAYTKTMKKNGYDVTKHKLHRTTEYRLIYANHLAIADKEE